MEPITIGASEVVRDFAIALFIGALVGLEREKRRGEDGDPGLGGIRTFVLFAMAGAISAWLAVQFDAIWLFVATVLGVAAIVIAGYVLQVEHQGASVGLTTEMAALVVTLLGGLTLFGYPGLAVALGITTSALLAFKQPLHGMVGRMASEDLFAGLKLLIATFIVLPLLPNRPVDPLGALNPYRLWLLVILIASLSLVGYVAMRLFGRRRGTSLTGIAGGLVSSTAVTLAFARESQVEDRPEGLGEILAAGILLAWVVMFIRVGVEVAVVYPPLLSDLVVPMTVMGLVTLAVAGLLLLRPHQVHQVGPDLVPLRNPFSLTSAAKFAGLFAVVLVLVRLAELYLPASGLYLVAGIAGLTDVDAITLSMASFARDGGNQATAAAAVVTAVLSNTLVKAGLAVTLGARVLRLRILTAAGLIVAAGLAALLI